MHQRTGKAKKGEQDALESRSGEGSRLGPYKRTWCTYLYAPLKKWDILR